MFNTILHELTGVHRTMVNWTFPGDTCEVHCEADACWAVQPVSAAVTIVTAIGFWAYLVFCIARGNATFAQCTCIAGFGVFEFVHGLSHRYNDRVQYVEYYQHVAFYLILVGLFCVLREKTGRMPHSVAWRTTAAALVLIDWWLVANYAVTLYNIILSVVMFRFLVAGFIEYLDDDSRQLYKILAVLQLMLLAIFVNEAFNCDRMVRMTNGKVAFHAFFEIGGAFFFIYFTRFFMHCKAKERIIPAAKKLVL